MEKNEFAGLVVYVIMLALAWVVGQTVIAFANKSVVLVNMSMVTYVIVCILISLVLFSVIFEVGHILGAKRGKYKVKSINILGFCFAKNENKWEFSFQSPEGLISESRFTPISEQSNPKKFLWGGALGYIVSVFIALGLFLIPGLNEAIKYGGMIYIAVGVILVFYNIIPLPLDTLNDGYRLKLLGDKRNIEAYNEYMRIEADVLKGGIAENVKVYEDITPMTVLVNMYAYYEMLDLGKRKEAERLIDKMLIDTKNIDVNTITHLLSQQVYFKIYSMDAEQAKEYYWKTLNDRERKAIANDKYLPSRRAYLLISGVINESISECRIALENYKKNIAKIKDITKKKVEIALFEEAIARVKEYLKEADFADLL